MSKDIAEIYYEEEDDYYDLDHSHSDYLELSEESFLEEALSVDFFETSDPRDPGDEENSS